MEWSIRRWRPGQLLASWAAYWAGLAAVSLGPILQTAWRVTQLPEGKGEISAGFTNSTLHFTVIEAGVRTVTATTSVGTAMAWVIGPPLALWLLWLVVRSHRDDPGPAALGEARRGQLGEGAPPAAEWASGRGKREPVEAGRIRTPNP
ncbi:MAG TPA: hypothetical protein VFZ21_16495 [Gemmatimonadaceae bacterium]|jgi:hypothetical protein|nr:hypothetical protein [Gemmatimonadaceae bacterium]